MNRDHLQRRLERAVDNYVDALDLQSLCSIVAESLHEHYEREATFEELLEFCDTHAPEEVSHA